jgi:MFS superfamily sulfate permease-like transporter
VPRSWVPALGMLLAAGSLGQLAGFAVPLLGTPAAAGLVLYFLGALVAHLRVGSRRLVGWAVFFSTAVAALTVNLIAAWKRRSAGDGVKGPRLYDWAVASLPDTGTAEHGHTKWLLIRRSITNPTELAYYLCYGPTSTTDEDLLRTATVRGLSLVVETGH